MKQLTRDYFNRHPLAQISAPRFLYSMLCYPGFDRKVGEMISADNHAEIEAVQTEEDISRLMRMLRRKYSPGTRELLREKLLSREDEMLPILMDDMKRAFNDSYIENAVHLLVDCEANMSNWIMEHFDEIRHPYTASSLCLVLGFRADPAAVPFLKKKLESFEKQYPAETYSQAPLLSLYRLQERFGDI